MQPAIEGCYLAGKIWNFRSEAYDDLNEVLSMLSDVPRCDTKKEMISLIRRSYAKLSMMEHRVKEAGNDYTLKDAIE